MKILLTGAAGMLAAEIIPRLKQEGHELFLTDINRRLDDIKVLDITNKDAVMKTVESYRPEFVFHLGAETNVDLCEQKPEHAFRVNAEGTENIALACARFKAKMLYISTGGVFYGDKKAPYREDDTPRPRNIYGESKLRGERCVQKLLKEYFIIRAGWMIGGWEIDKKFVYKIIQQLISGKTELRVVSDKFGSPTFTKDFAANLMDVLRVGSFGLYHMANKGTCSRYEIALKIIEAMDLKHKVRVEPITSDEFPLPAPRADSEMIDNYRLERLGLNHMPFWQDSLREYISLNKDRYSEKNS